MNVKKRHSEDVESAQRLLIVTLALEQELYGEDHSAVSALLSEREAILDRLGSAPISIAARATLDQVHALDDRLIRQLQSWRSEALRGLTLERDASRAAGTYKPPVARHGFEARG
jgi:hypothetical protein